MNTQSKKTVLRSLGVVLVAVLVFTGIGITGAAAQAAIPGDALYPVKSTIEQTRLSFAADAGDRAELRLGYAETRLQEIQALIAEGRYREVGEAVLAFEADLNGAILELDTISRLDPARGSRIALEITSALSGFAQSLSVMAAGAPESVRSDVARALDTTGLAGSFELSSDDSSADDNGNDNANVNGDDDTNVNGDDDTNVNGDDDSNVNGDDDCATGTEDGTNTNGDDSCPDDDSNVNGDDNSNVNGDDNSNVNGDDSSGGAANENGDDSSGSGSGGGGGSDDGSGSGSGGSGGGGGGGG